MIVTAKLKYPEDMALLNTKIKPTPQKPYQALVASKLWAEKSTLRSANVTGLDNQHLGDILAEGGLLQEKTVTGTEIALTGEDRILGHRTEIEDAENTQMRGKENTKIEIKSKAREETETVQDQGKKSTEKEEKADQIRKENDSTHHWSSDLYKAGISFKI